MHFTLLLGVKIFVALILTPIEFIYTFSTSPKPLLFGSNPDLKPRSGDVICIFLLSWYFAEAAIVSIMRYCHKTLKMCMLRQQVDPYSASNHRLRDIFGPNFVNKGGIWTQYPHQCIWPVGRFD